MIKKLFVVGTTILLVLTLNACGDENQEAPEENPYSEPPRAETFEFENLSEEFDVENHEVSLYFYEEGIPYIDIEDFIDLLEGAIRSDIIRTDYEKPVYHMNYTLNTGSDDEHELELDLDTNILTVDRMEFFRRMSEPTGTNRYENISIVNQKEDIKAPITINLNDYGMATVEKEENVHIPFHLANLLFSGNTYTTYYNGERIYGVDIYQLEDEPPIADALNDSPLNSEEIPAPVKKFTTDYLALSFDYFYGLRNRDDIESYDEVLADYQNDLNADATAHYRAIHDFLLARDDLHTALIMNGFYEEDLTFEQDPTAMEERAKTYHEALDDASFSDHCAAGGRVELNGDGTKAIVKIDRFDIESLNLFKAHMDFIDTKGTVEDVAIDLSCNGGGSVGIMNQVLGYMRYDFFPLHTKDAVDGSTMVTTYKVDIELRDYDFHVLSSPRTYSAGNLFLSQVKENNLATIIGEPSSGGASPIFINAAPSGSVFSMSSSKVLTNSHYESIESGIEPDEAMPMESIMDSDDVFDAMR